MKKLHFGNALVATVACVALVSNANGQSSDALIDKLVDKGILTIQEAKDLREEADKDFTRAYSAKSGMPEWVSALKFNGDLRGRYDSIYFENPAGTTRQRFRYRLRFGLTANLFDDFELGIRLTSAENANGGFTSGDPISGNVTYQDNASKKLIFIDLAYMKWSPIHNADWSAAFTLGKMENPFVFSDMVFDSDYTPEGAAMQLAYNFNDVHALKLNAGAFMMDELSASSSDPFFYGAQLRFDSAWNPKWQSSVGVAALAVVNDQFLNASRSSTFNVTSTATNLTTTTSWTVPNQTAGNLRTPVTCPSGAVGNLLNHYNPVVADAGLTYNLDRFWHYNALFPIRVAGEYMYNPAARSQGTAWSAGVAFGKSGKRGLWDLSYRYKHMEGDAWFEEFVDSDFGAFYQATSTRSGGASGYLPGTNLEGHVIRAAYSPFDSFTLSITAYIANTIQSSPAGSQSGTTRLQMDGILKF